MTLRSRAHAFLRGVPGVPWQASVAAQQHVVLVLLTVQQVCPIPCRLALIFSCLLQVKILSSLITAVLPGIVLTIFLALLPALLSLLNKKVQKMVSETDVEFGVVRKYFAFQVLCPILLGC